MSLFEHPEFDNHEQVVFCHDQEFMKAIIAIHDITQPKPCGTRLGITARQVKLN